MRSILLSVACMCCMVVVLGQDVATPTMSPAVLVPMDGNPVVVEPGSKPVTGDPNNLLGLTTDGAKTLANVLLGNAELLNLTSALKMMEYLVTELSDTFELYTVFAPVNSAFITWDPKFSTPSWGAHLELLLRFHLVQGTIPSTNLMDGMSITTLVSVELAANDSFKKNHNTRYCRV